jgi:hypothetical protein
VNFFRPAASRFIVAGCGERRTDGAEENEEDSESPESQCSEGIFKGSSSREGRVHRRNRETLTGLEGRDKQYVGCPNIGHEHETLNRRGGKVARKRTRRTTKRVKNLAAKKVNARQAKEVKGGEIVITKDSDKTTNKLL